MKPLEKSILYFRTPGPKNTEATIQAAKKRAEELRVEDIVVASTYGDTGLKVAEAFKGTSMNIVVATICMGFREEGWVMSEERRKELQKRNVKVLTCIHALADDVSSSFGGRAANAIVAEALYRFSQGMKVCVEIAVMAADAGLIPVNRDVISIGGTDRGADTAILVKPSYARKFLDLKVREIIAKPR